MTTALVVVAWLSAAYVLFTFSATGWAKLVTVPGTARALRAAWPVLPGGVAVAIVIALGSVEVGLAGAAVLWPAEPRLAFGCAGLLVAFAIYNAAEARGDSAGRAPCLCMGGTARALDASGYARAVANILLASVALVWATQMGTPLLWSQAALLVLWVMPLVVWALRRARPPVARFEAHQTT